ncbi:Hypothetical predicted protein [Paramuricea clavata]|uniref:Uncharacterized protein n=1 Tax=Paramuricea clavata TaxID=317549 RepID=A0A7D9HRP6_PARCT|nr:Hypothetical predicted protein [Paramuricea clavata]
MKDMGKLHYCLGVNIKMMDGVLQMSQEQYIHKILHKYKLQDCKPVSTPMVVNVKLVKDDGYSKAVDPVEYQSMGTVKLHLQYEASDKDIEGYSDADWAVDSYDRRSTSGNIFVMSNGAISWASQKQPTVAFSTAEAEYIALYLAT